ncbi:MAG: HupE/UreJ family protein [Pseudomonadota bacterium]
MIRLALALPLTMLTGPAMAHGTLPGGGGFYSGALHPVVALDHLLAVLALGLLSGRLQTRLPVAGFVAGLIAGLAWAQPLPWGPVVILLLTLALGGVLAADMRLRARVLAGLALLLGAVLGTETDTGAAGLAATTGTIVAASLILLNAMALAGVLRAPPRGIVLRVAGSWLVAIACLMLALRLGGTA